MFWCRGIQRRVVAVELSSDAERRGGEEEAEAGHTGR
jgi:hypothetical protein